MILENLIQRVQSKYSKGVQSDDSRLSPRHIYSVLKSTRALLYTQKINKRQPLSEWDYQTLNCLEVIEAKPYECPCLPSIGCYILRTKEKIPSIIEGLYEAVSVNSVDGEITFTRTSWKTKKHKSGAKYTSSNPDYYIKDGYIYITVKSGLKAISVTAVFNDPIVAGDYVDMCTGNNNACISMQKREFPISANLVDSLIKLASIELVEEFNKSKEDISNNSRDTNQEETK